MSRPLCSVVLATYQRAHLLGRSLASYAKQEFDNSQFELVVIDDHSTDNTREMVLDWSLTTKIRTVYLTAAPKLEAWRDCGAILNYGIRATSGQHIILTHPEVIPGRRSVSTCVRWLELFEKERKYRLAHEIGPLGCYACCKPYYLSPRDQEWLDTVPWLVEGALAVREIEGFYDLEQHAHGNPDYTPRAIEAVGNPGYRHTHWLSWVFGGCSRETWKRLGGMLETQKWGAVDVAWMQRRQALGIINHTCLDDETLCIHQNHDDPTRGNVPTPRIEEAWKQELREMNLAPKDLLWPGCDHLGW